MLLEFGKALSLLLSILSLYRVAISAFFVPAARWGERVLMALPWVGIAGCVCVASGLLFRWPARTNPDANGSLASTLPVQMFLWGVPGMAILFGLGWYLVCASPNCSSVSYYCG
jgi:hypothetical protein